MRRARKEAVISRALRAEHGAERERTGCEERSQVAGHTSQSIILYATSISSRVPQGGRNARIPFLEAAIEPPAGGFDACGARAVPGRTRLPLRNICIHSSPPRAASEHAGGASRVSFAHPDRLRLFRAPHGALVSRQSACGALGTEATCGPRRPNGLVVLTQGRSEHPAAASRSRTLGKKYRTSLFTYIVGAPSAAHPSWPYRLHSAPAPSALPSQPTQRCPDT